MSRASRGPRVNHNSDADGERRIWSQIRNDAKKVDSLNARSATIGNEIVTIEVQQGALLDEEKPSDATLDERLESLYRENIRISEQIQHMIEGNGDGMNLLENIRVLQGLRQESEDSSQISIPITSRREASASAKGRGGPGPKRKATAIEDGEEGSAAPSPRVSNGRLAAAEPKKPRGNSAQPSTREVSVKIEDGDSVTSSVEGTKTAIASSTTDFGANARPRLTLNVGDMVFYRNKGRTSEGEGILCRVTSVIGEGKQRRYEIQDADPDPAPTGEIPAPYRASVSHLVPIPITNAGLSDLPRGKNVLAQYPDTTTFYKAEVSTAWRTKDAGTDRGDVVRLRFEGEMEESKETEVERRFVLVEK